MMVEPELNSPPADLESTDPDARSWPRQAARLSIAAAYVCFTFSCVLNQLFLKPTSGDASWPRLVVDSVSFSIVLGGIVLGIQGVRGGLRQKSNQTAIIAFIGLLLNLGIVLLVLWGVWVLRNSRLPGGPGSPHPAPIRDRN